MATDVVGYSRLIRTDEEGTIAALKALRADIIDPKLAEHHGRIVKLMGDGMLAEFSSVVDAVRAAVETQQAVAEHNSGLPKDKRIEFRVGINLGDVVIDGDDIQGDGVNVAARLEGLAPPGGVCISGSVHEQVRDRLDLPFEDLGEQEVKNIARPVRVWQWSTAGSTTAESPINGDAPLALPDKPSIVVKPFHNLSEDPDQAFFASGISEDINTELSRYGEILVVSHSSSPTHQNERFDPRAVSKDLGVGHILAGSVRRAGNRIRVTAQLIDARSGTQLWADRFDRNLEDIFAVQDEITAVIVNTLLGKLRHREFERSLHKRPETLDAYDHALRATVLLTNWDREDTKIARSEAEKAVSLEPGFARAHALLAWAHCLEAILRWVDDPADSFKNGYKSAVKAAELDDHEPWAHAALGFAELWGRHEYDRGIMSLRNAIELNPNNAYFRLWISNAYCLAGRHEEGMKEIEIAMRLNPDYPPVYLHFLGRLLVTLGRFEEALPYLERLVKAMPTSTNSLALFAACNAGLGQLERAKTAVKDLLELSPSFSLAVVPEHSPYALSQDLEAYLDLLRKSGLPEES
jgi:adenylate cyclase